jgi:predicted nucleic acid-binding protein
MEQFCSGSGFVLDSNAIIDLIEDREDSYPIRRLVNQWRNGKVQLSVCAVSASENVQKSAGETTRSVAAFKEKLVRAGLDEADVLRPLLLFDFSFWNETIWPDDRGQYLYDRLVELLVPAGLHDPPDAPESNSKWRNELCDVMIAWCCIYHGWPNLVTRDAQRFHKAGRKEALRKMGLTVIHPNASPAS